LLFMINGELPEALALPHATGDSAVDREGAKAAPRKHQKEVHVLFAKGGPHMCTYACASVRA